MLNDSPIAGAIEGGLPVVSNIPPQDFSSDQVSGAESWHCAHLNQQPGSGYMNFVSCRGINSDASSSLKNHSNSGLQISASSTMSGNSVPLCVYRRKKLQKNSGDVGTNQAAENIKVSDGFNSSSGSRVHSKCMKDLGVSVEAETRCIGSPQKIPDKCTDKCTANGFVSNCGSSDEIVPRKDPCVEEALRNDKRTVLDGCGIGDSCSSSKSHPDVVTHSHKTNVEESGQFSSSGALLSARSQDFMSGRDFCIAILRSKGLLRESPPIHHLSSADNINDICCVKECKVCTSSETSLNMRICDGCEDAFHVKCCNPRVKKLLTGEWFCYSCLKMKRKVLKGKSNRDSSKSRIVEFGPILSMLNNSEPSKFTVRIGDEFQAEVPDWPPSTADEDDPLGEPEEIDWSEHLNLNKICKVGRSCSISNWVQCQEVIQGTGGPADGEICGKWRRAPLFEVQTDHLDCFHTILWDLAHADCAVPQELPTEEVLRQLKYIEMMKPRMVAKKRKLNRIKAGLSQGRKK